MDIEVDIEMDIKVDTEVDIEMDMEVDMEVDMKIKIAAIVALKTLIFPQGFHILHLHTGMEKPCRIAAQIVEIEARMAPDIRRMTGTAANI